MNHGRGTAGLASALLLLVAIAAIAVLSGASQGASSGTANLGILPSGICDIAFVQGWNFISFCADISDRAVTSVLTGVDFRYVMFWNDSTQAFDIFSPLATANPFAQFEINRSYFIYINPVSASTSVGETNNANMNISLSSGWNAPAWPYEFGANLSRYFNATIHRYIMKWNSTSQSFMIFSPRAIDNPFLTINRTEGQFIYSIVPNNLTYNRTALQS